jgi:hypothetical protein
MDSQCYKEVYFHQYCKTCQHQQVKEKEEPCDECMSEPINLNTHRPVKYEAKETKR